MLLTVLACIYISVLCWAWGWLFSFLITKISGKPGEHFFSFTCLTGLCFILIVSGILSLFLPLGSFFVQFFFCLPAGIVLARVFKKEFVPSIRQGLNLHPMAIFLLLVSLLVILVMSSWKIIHPDTLGYHAQLIQWAEKHKAIPGLVHLNTRYGLQSYWFLGSALFSFKFLGSPALLYLNVAVLSWFLLFVIYKINSYFVRKEKSDPQLFFWILLFGFSFWSYTQIRLMATSASPDFFAVLLIWAAFYYFMGKNQVEENSHTSIIYHTALFCGTAITVKLFALPLILLVGLLLLFLLRQKKINQAAVVSGIILLTIVPYLIRNVIASGYPLFPSAIGGQAVDWRLDEATTHKIADYVTAYSRTGISDVDAIPKDNLPVKVGEWIPAWWRILSLADKFLLCFLLISLLVSLFKFNKYRKAPLPTMITLGICFLGLLFWFFKAPDPRFGYGYLLAFIGILLSTTSTSFLFAGYRKAAFLFQLLFGMILLSYAVYRFQNFYLPHQWLIPAGIEKVKYKTLQCENNLSLQVPESDWGCSDVEIPCSSDSCTKFSLRSNRLTEGFKAK